MFTPSPHLPPAREGMDWRALHAFRQSDRRGAFYLACLEYGQALWCQARPARAMLCLDRAFGADLVGTEPELARWPMPYAAMLFIMRETPAGVFLGNPRVHFQHYAGRMNEPRREQRQWRAWACWALARAALPELPGDPRHHVAEPSEEQIWAGLAQHGLAGEPSVWSRVRDAAHRT